MKTIITSIVLTVTLFWGTVLASTPTPLLERFNKTIEKENYVLVEEPGFKKIVVPFHYNSTKTDFDNKALLRIDYRRIRKVEYVHYSNKSKSHQNMLNVARVDSLNSMFKGRLRFAKDAEYSKVILSNHHVDRTQFTGFVITLERTAKENAAALDAIVNHDTTKIEKPSFVLDTLKTYGYVLPHLTADPTLAEYSVINGVLARNPNWKDQLILIDVTGSMLAYISQYMLWLRLNYNPRKHQGFVFFNDGNNAPDHKKVTGNTGGIYYASSNKSFEQIKDVAYKAMLSGGGGDCPENNIEALIRGTKRFYGAKEIIMVADNYATPRDMSLLSKVDKPVRVVLCGTNTGFINTAYFDLAYKTGGSLHTIESDLVDLVKKKDGEVFEFERVKYIVKDGGIDYYNEDE